MPLSPPVEREVTHLRDIVLRGYSRADGMIDVDAHLADTKSYDFANLDRGEIRAGTPLHGMKMRMTVDDSMTIVAFEASTEYGPYSICPQAAPNFSRLAGLTIARGFLKAAAERVGGTQGCTHLRELLQQMATVAYQTHYSHRMRRATAAAEQSGREMTTEEIEASIARRAGDRPANLNTCLAYDTANSPVVKRRWPAFYTGADREDVAADS